MITKILSLYAGTIPKDTSIFLSKIYLFVYTKIIITAIIDLPFILHGYMIMGASFYKLELVPRRYIKNPLKEYDDGYTTMPYILEDDHVINQCFVKLSHQFKGENVTEISTRYDMDKIHGLDKKSPDYKVQYFNSIAEVPYLLRQYAPKEDGLIIMASDGRNIRFLGGNDADQVAKQVLVFKELDWQSKGYYLDKFDEFLNKYDTYIIFPEMLTEFKQCFPMSCPIQEWTLNKNEIIYISM